jgi:hypothetical protein
LYVQEKNFLEDFNKIQNDLDGFRWFQMIENDVITISDINTGSDVIPENMAKRWPCLGHSMLIRPRPGHITIPSDHYQTISNLFFFASRKLGLQ